MPLLNADLAYRVLDHIDADLRRLHQQDWLTRGDVLADPPPCGTAACFAGWTCLLSGDKPSFDDWTRTDYVEQSGTGTVLRADARAMDLLNIEDDAADALFSPDNTREDLGYYVEEIFGPRPESVDR